MKQLYKIEVASGLEYESIAECGLGLKLNDKVVVQCERYLDFAKVSKICGDPILDEAEHERPPYRRPEDPADPAHRHAGGHRQGERQ